MRKVILVQLILVVSMVSTFGQHWQESGNNIYYDNGNVGIGVGTRTPNFKLEVAGTFRAFNSYLSNASIGRSGTHYDEFGYNIGFTGISDTYTYRDNDFAASIRMGYNGSIEFRTAGLGNAGENIILSERMRINLNGNVGIGTSSPEHKLHVIGKISGQQLESTHLFCFPQYKRTYDQKDLYDYGLSWNGDSWHTGAHSLWISGFGGIKLFTSGESRLSIHKDGNVGIGTTDPTARLTVAGDILAREIRVEANAGADFVFEENYPLKPLKEVKQFITENRHLPDIAPADSMMQNGVNMGEFQIQLLQKIEELTLYMIKQEQRIDELTLELDALKKDQ